MLPSLVEVNNSNSYDSGAKKRALVIGQPLVGAGLLSPSHLPVLTERIHRWLIEKNIVHVDYKAHPKDKNMELFHSDYRLIEPQCILESYLASNRYDAVIGVRSTTLLFARQIYSLDVYVVAFGWELINFKSSAEYEDMKKAFIKCGVQLA